MHDTGSQILRWRKAQLSKRQIKYFPNGIVPKKWQTIKEIHDDVSKQANRLEGLGELVMMPWDEAVMGLHGMRCGEVTLMLPRTNLALVRWGKAQGHCVGSMYNRTMQQGQCTIVGAFSQGKLLYCIRLSSQRKRTGESNPETWAESARDGVPAKFDKEWVLSEFRGQGNCWPQAVHAADVLEMLKTSGVVVDGWAASQNGYGKSKDGSWDADLAQLQLVRKGVTKPAIVVRNFTQTKVESDKPVDTYSGVVVL